MEEVEQGQEGMQPQHGLSCLVMKCVSIKPGVHMQDGRMDRKETVKNTDATGHLIENKASHRQRITEVLKYIYSISKLYGKMPKR